MNKSQPNTQTKPTHPFGSHGRVNEKLHKVTPSLRVQTLHHATRPQPEVIGVVERLRPLEVLG